MSYKQYFCSQLKRIQKLALPTLAVFAVILAVVLMLASAFIKRTDEDKKATIKIGVVGENDTPIISGILGVLEKYDDIGYTLEFVFLDEDEAKTALRLEDISAYCVIPEGFEDALSYDEECEAIRFYSNGQGSGINSLFLQELVKMLSDVLSDINSGVYGLKDAFIKLQGDYDPDVINALFLEYIDYFLNRTELVNAGNVGVADGMDTVSFYICSFSLFLIFIFALCASLYFINRNEEFGILLISSGVSEKIQVLLEYAAFCVYAVFLTLVILAVFASVNLTGIVQIPISTELTVNLFVSALMILAFEFMMYELIEDTICKMLVQFVMYLFMTFVSGYFYPSMFLPKAVRILGEVLPTGVCLKSMTSAYTDNSSILWVCLCVLYMIIFLSVSILFRTHKIKRKLHS